MRDFAGHILAETWKHSQHPTQFLNTLFYTSGMSGLTNSELRMISASTSAYYEERAQVFRDRAWSESPSQPAKTLAAKLKPGQSVLDAGCGPGRDLAYLAKQGLCAYGLDHCRAFVAMAEVFADVPVWHQDLFDLTLPREFFDGVLAVSTLHHVPRERLAETLARIGDSLKEGGYLVCSNPKIHEARSCEGRFLANWSLKDLMAFMDQLGLRVLDAPDGDVAPDTWIAMTAQKVR